jgi:hypothetical protein
VVKVRAIQKKEIVVDLPDEFITTFLEGFITLVQTNPNCEYTLLIYMLKVYKDSPIVSNSKEFRKAFQTFCMINQNRDPFADSTIKRAFKTLKDLSLIQQPEYGKYRLHQKFFIFTE